MQPRLFHEKKLSHAPRYDEGRPPENFGAIDTSASPGNA